ncbi:hypothetical protein ACFLXB_03605 [Chloroflexota bacterium]
MNEKPTLATLVEWRDKAVKDLEISKEELINVQQKYKASEERLELFERLLALEGKIEPKESSFKVSATPDLIDECENILREAGNPLHIDIIHAKLLERGVAIPGRGNRANVITRIQRSNGKVIRTGRGIYGLPEFGTAEVKPKKKTYK